MSLGHRTGNVYTSILQNLQERRIRETGAPSTSCYLQDASTQLALTILCIVMLRIHYTVSALQLMTM